MSSKPTTAKSGPGSQSALAQRDHGAEGNRVIEADCAGRRGRSGKRSVEAGHAAAAIGLALDDDNVVGRNAVRRAGLAETAEPLVIDHHVVEAPEERQVSVSLADQMFGSEEGASMIVGRHRGDAACRQAGA